VADYGGTPASEVDGPAGGVPNWGVGDNGAVRPQAPSHLTRWGVSSEQDAEWQALLTAQQVRTSMPMHQPSRDLSLHRSQAFFG